MYKLPLFITVLLPFFFAACKPDFNKKIGVLEAKLAQHYSVSAADSLTDLYLKAVKSNPKDHERNYRNLCRAVELRFIGQQRDATSAARWLDEALNVHGKAIPHTEAAGLLARVWHAYMYKTVAATGMDPDDIDRMHANLLKNMNWIDSSLVETDKAMFSAETGSIDRKMAENFLEIAETQAALLQELNQTDRYVEIVLTAAGLAKNIGNPNKALQFYYKVEHYLPSHVKAPTALFMTGFIYENDLHDLDKAKSTYQEFLERYSDDLDNADDARQALKMLGKSPEELVREFEKQGKIN